MPTKRSRTAAISEGPHSPAAGTSEAVARSGNRRADPLSEAPAAEPAGSSATPPFAGLADAAARWMPEQVAKPWTEALADGGKGPVPAFGFGGDAWDYWVDAWQRSVLYLDVMRRRGNQYHEHLAEKAPHVLSFTG